MSSTLWAIIGVVIITHVNGSLGLKACNDCIPYMYCKEAKQLADTNRSELTRQAFRNAFCGILNTTIVKVCCSDFDTPNQEIQRNVEPEHRNIGLLPDNCGNILAGRIIFGGDALISLYEFPWMVLIAYADNKFKCSGSLINSRYVLTAAHCVLNKDIKSVRIGEYNVEQEIDCLGNVCENNIQDIEVESYVIHDDYEWITFTNDIALLRLTTPVDLNLKNAGTICLPTTREMQNRVLDNLQATVAGWGLSEYGDQFTILRKVVFPVRTADVCQNYYSHMLDQEQLQICAGKYKKDSCRGDSGGPLMIETLIKDEAKFVQYGIVSNGPARCGSDVPGVYTDVRKYMKWILDNVKP